MARTRKRTGSISFEHRTGTVCADAGTRLHRGCTGRWIGVISIGTDAVGKRVRRKVTGKTRSDVAARLKMLHAQLAKDAARRLRYTVGDAVDDWLVHSRRDGESPNTMKARQHVAQHLYRTLGQIRLRDLTETDVSAAMEKLACELSDSHLRRVHTSLRSAIGVAHRTGLVLRDVADRASVPDGQQGRPSKALPWALATGILEQSRLSSTRLYPYLLVCLTSGLSDQEARALRWDHVVIGSNPTAEPSTRPHLIAMRYSPVPSYTCTERTPQRLVVPDETTEALRHHHVQQAKDRLQAGSKWQDNGLVFTTRTGTALDAHNVRRSFRELLSNIDGINPADWTLRELQCTYVARLAELGVPVDEIRWRVGQRSLAQTFQIYGDVLTPECMEARSRFNLGLLLEQARQP
jgi:integrase